MNLLSGTMWKGSKLRIGEAKPDFRERCDCLTSAYIPPGQHSHSCPCRIKRENEAPPVERPRKKRRLARGVKGVHSSEMSLVTLENASSRHGWHVTPTGRIVHPIRMRPGKPLPPVFATTPSATGKTAERKKRKLLKATLVRSRRRTIDPTRWNSQHLKGAFLDSVVVADDVEKLPAATPPQSRLQVNQEESDSSSWEEEDQEGESDSSELESITGESLIGPGTTRQPPSIALAKDTTDHDANEEKLRALSLLESMFGGLEGNKEWGGREELDSDVEMPLPAQAPPSQRSPSQEVLKGADPIPAVEEAQGYSESEQPSVRVPTPTPENALEPETVQNVTTKAKLKDLFAPQEEQGVLPLVNHVSET